jgi:hypothetical protein
MFSWSIFIDAGTIGVGFAAHPSGIAADVGPGEAGVDEGAAMLAAGEVALGLGWLAGVTLPRVWDQTMAATTSTTAMMITTPMTLLRERWSRCGGLAPLVSVSVASLVTVIWPPGVCVIPPAFYGVSMNGV